MKCNNCNVSDEMDDIRPRINNRHEIVYYCGICNEDVENTGHKIFWYDLENSDFSGS